MSEWVDRVKNNAVWQHMDALGPAIDQALTREGLEASAIDGLERVRTVLAFCGKRLASAEPVLLRPAPLDLIAAAFQSAVGEVQNFAADGDMARIARANAKCDEVLAAMADVSTPSSVDELASIMEAAAQYRSSLERGLAEVAQLAKTSATTLQSDAAATQQRLSELQAEISAERTRLTTLTLEFQAQFSTAQDTRGKDFTDAQTARQDRFAVQAQEFSDSQTSRNDRFAALHEEFSKKLTEQDAEFTRQRDAKIKQNAEEIAELRTQYSAAGQKILDEIQEHRKSVEKLVGVIGNLGVTSGYLTTANQAKKLTWFWQAATVVAMGGLIWVAYRAFLPTIEAHPANQPFDWPGFAGRVFVSLTVGVLAAYAAAQADRQSEMEKRNRRLALEFEAIGPYLAPLPEEQQHKFRIEVGERSFGREDSSGGRTSPATTVDILLKSKEFNQIVATIAKSVNKQS